MTQYLCFTNRINCFNCFQFTNNTFFNKDIKLQTLLKYKVVINNWNINLPSIMETSLFQFVAKANLIYFLK